MVSSTAPYPRSFSLSSRVAPLLTTSAVAGVAAEAGFDSVDVDLTGRWGALRAGRVGEFGSGEPLPIGAYWLPGDRRWAQIVDRIGIAGGLQSWGSPPRLILPLPAMGGDRFRADVTGVARAVRQAAGDGVSITFAVRWEQLVGGRAHLAQLTLLRRLAAEWEFDLAFDLAGRVDPRWEAEAAVVRLGSRLRVVRIGGAVLKGSWAPPARLAARTMTAALHSPDLLLLSLVPPLYPWQAVLPAEIGRAAAAARGAVAARAASLDAQRATARDQGVPGPSFHGERP